MPKYIPPCPDVPKGIQSDLEKTEYTIQIITPLFGGGVEAGMPDETMPIRGTSIRGQLQFWWRATRGSTCSGQTDLFTRQAEIWGTTERASPVQVEIRDVQTSAPKSCAEYQPKYDGKLRPQWKPPFNEKDSPLPYVLFSFQGQLSKNRKTIEKNPAQFIEPQINAEYRSSFTLLLRFPKAIQDDVEIAVWAWVNFGGLGARTRRGCGALFCEQLAPKDVDDLTNWFRNRAGTMSHQTHEWPTLPDRFLFHPTPQDPVEAWKQVTKLMQDFRQGKGIGRNLGTDSNHPGRSRWPEPETIRNITGQRASKHARIQDIPDAFPRAELGLPIIFHFQGHGEPPDTTLYPTNGPDDKSFERMASPLILKPLALTKDQAIPVIMRLRTLPLANVDLRQGKTSLSLPPSTIVRGNRLATYPNSPLQGTDSGSALDAFLKLAKTRGFREGSQ